MNIWYLCKYVSKPGHGYVGMRGYFLMKELSKLGFNVDLITSSSNSFLNQLESNKSKEISKTFYFHQIKGIRYGKANSIARIISWIEFEIKFFFFNKKKNLRKPDIIFVSSLSLLSILNGLFWKKFYSARLVFEVRDIWPLTLIEEGRYSKINPLIFFLSIIEKLGYKHSDLIIGTMPNLSEHIENILPNNDLKVICIPFGFPGNTSTNLFRHDLSVNSNNTNFIIGYLGTVGKTNALDTLFSAIENIDLVKLGIECHIGGDGPLLNTYKKKYNKIKNIKFLGHIRKENVAKVLSSFDVVYFSTFNSRVWKYGQSLNKIIDYMLSGKPILASYSGYPSMINEANCGWFVEAEDSEALAKKIIELSTLGKSNLTRTGIRGREWILKNRNYSKLASYLKDEILSITN